MAAPYQYRPLPARTSLRRCIIHPLHHAATHDDEIVVEIDVVDFPAEATDLEAETPEDFPIYETLSYVWGSEDDPRHILVQCPDDGVRRSLQVTRNLHDALRHLRQRESARTMWIDAICINQQDNAEKEPQVAMMGAVYRRARRVVVWLGPSADSSGTALEWMGHTGRQITVDFEGSPWVQSAAAEKTLAISDAELFAIGPLLERPWFGRLWIRQEIYLADAESAIIVCGCDEVAWLPFRNSLALLDEMKYTDVDFFEQVHLLDTITSMHGFIFQHRPTYPEGLRRIFGAARCRDPRDRVYGILGLLHPLIRNGLGITSDYDSTVADVYINLTLRYLRLRGQATLLPQCGIEENPNTAKDSSYIPSWSPDWSRTPDDSVDFSLHSFASSCIHVTYKLSRNLQVLSLAGVEVATVNRLGPCVMEEGVVHWTDVMRGAVGRLLSGQPDSINAQEVDDETLACVLATGQLEDVMYPTNDPADWGFVPLDKGFVPPDKATEAARLVRLGRDSDFKEENMSPDMIGVLTMFRRNLDGRRLALADTRDADGAQLLICPRTARHGDVVCVLAGCPSPMLLRPAAATGIGGSGDHHGETSGGGYLVVGQCFSAATMHGTALLGPLPGGVRAAMVHMGDGAGHLWGFVHDATGEASFRDPRLEGFPPDEESHLTHVPYQALKDLVLKTTGRELRWFDLV